MANQNTYQMLIDGAWVDLSTRHKALAERYRDLLDLK